MSKKTISASSAPASQTKPSGGATSRTADRDDAYLASLPDETPEEILRQFKPVPYTHDIIVIEGPVLTGEDDFKE
jgi:hypothetical protein